MPSDHIITSSSNMISISSSITHHTGGKDSVLALHELYDQYNIILLVTFAPEGSGVSSFLAHPGEVIAYQSKALGIRHVVSTIKPEEGKYLEAYQVRGERQRETERYHTLITPHLYLIHHPLFSPFPLSFHLSLTLIHFFSQPFVL